jgi:hypothetical protein
MSCKQITFDNAASAFQFGGGDPFTFAEIGSVIGNSLKAGEELVNLGTVRVSADYLTSMMRFAATNGWFNDSFDLCVGDHDFDVNVATPGYDWGKVVTLRACVVEFRDYASRAAAAHSTDEQHWNGLADAAEQRIADYLRTGEMSSINDLTDHRID